VKSSRAQIFLAIVLFAPLMSIFGETYRINFTDVDGNALSTADDRTTILVLTSKTNVDKATALGERIPDFCLGNPNYRMITLIAFETNHSAPIRAVLKSAIRHRLDSEGHRLQTRYDQHKIARDARRDVFAAADFDDAITAQLKSKWSPDLFHVFVFGKNGELLKQWSDVPAAEDLAAALKQN